MAELLVEAQRAGIRLRAASDDRLVIAGQPEPVLLARLRANKAALVALLRPAPAPGVTP